MTRGDEGPAATSRIFGSDVSAPEPIKSASSDTTGEDQPANTVEEQRAGARPADHSLVFFSPHQYRTLSLLCKTIIPADDSVEGAIEAGVPEFIDLITSESKLYQLKLGGGIMWLDAVCRVRHGKNFVDCEPRERQQILDVICNRETAKNSPPLNQGVEFFALLRKLTVDGFFTSEIGISYLQYVGNTYLEEFPGCPPIPGVEATHIGESNQDNGL
jgi:gluconate 2-dehydrogenase subunit 3-like protein